MDQKGIDQKRKELMFSKVPFECLTGHWVNQSYYYHPHWHDFLELLIIRQGSLHVTLKNTKLIVKKNELLVVMPGDLHSTLVDGEGVYDHFVIHIDSGFFQNSVFDSLELSNIYPYLFSSRSPHSFVCGVEEMKKSGMQPLFKKIISEYTKKEPGYTLSIRAGLLEVFVWLLRRWKLDSRSESEAGDLSNLMRMQPILDFIKEKYSQKITTNEMADKINVSVYHFCRLFKKLTGCSFQSYLRSLRIDAAIKLLLSGDDNVKKIASLVGYGDENFFIRVFKRETGLPPVEYRKKYGSSDSIRFPINIKSVL